MSINSTGTFVPASSTFGIANASDLIGGFAQFANEAAIGAIASGRLVVGQQAYSQSSGITYQLTSLTPGGGFANGTWVVVTNTSSNAWAAVKLVATSNLSLTGEQTIDGVLTSASRVLLVGQTAQSQNGLYVTASGAWSRATDANTSGAFVAGKTVAATAGSTLAGSIWVYNGASSPTLGTTAITFAENSAGGSTFNPHAPGPIGDVTPGTGAFTSLILSGALTLVAGTTPNLGGYNTIAMGNADHIASAAEYSGYWLNVFDTGWTASHTLTLPLSAGTVWLIRASFTGSFSLVIGNGTAKTVTIAPNTEAIVSTDGTDFFSVSGGGGGISVDATVITSANSGVTTMAVATQYKFDAATSFSWATPADAASAEGDEFVVSIAPGGTCDATHTLTLTLGTGMSSIQNFDGTFGSSIVINRAGAYRFKKLVNGATKSWCMQ